LWECKAEKLSDIVEVGMLNNQIPLRVIHIVVEVCDCDLHMPVLFVVSFHMPMNSDGTHMLCTLQERLEVVLPTAVAGSCAQELIKPPRQQFNICWLYGVPGNKSTTVGVFLQQ